MHINFRHSNIQYVWAKDAFKTISSNWKIAIKGIRGLDLEYIYGIY